MQKWNVFKQKYEPYEVPKDWNVKTCSSNMEEIINCAQCGKPIKVGFSYVSMEVHTPMGLGYLVCPDCYNKEWERIRGVKP